MLFEKEGKMSRALVQNTSFGKIFLRYKIILHNFDL